MEGSPESVCLAQSIISPDCIIVTSFPILNSVSTGLLKVREFGSTVLCMYCSKIEVCFSWIVVFLNSAAPWPSTNNGTILHVHHVRN